MKTIEQNEIYEHLSQFLKSRGVEMKDGSYARRIQKGCGLLTDAVNLTQKGMGKAKTEIDKRLDQLRQVIHERTAPKPAPTQISRVAAQRSNKRASRRNKSRTRKPGQRVRGRGKS